MTLAAFLEKMAAAAVRAVGRGLTADDLTLIRSAGAAWQNAGCPDTGFVAEAWSRAQYVNQLDDMRELGERRARAVAQQEIQKLTDEIRSLNAQLVQSGKRRRYEVGLAS